MADPWRQRADESEKAYQAFQFYLEERDKTQFAAFLDYCEWNWDGDRADAERKDRTDRKPPRWFERWPSEHDWTDRRRAFYDHVDHEAHKRLMESKARRKVKRVETLDDAHEQLSKLVPDIVSMAYAEGLSVKDLINAIDKVMANYRKELDDMPTERHEVNAPQIKEKLNEILGVGDVQTDPKEPGSE